jgi:phosphoribosylaminoimidazole-succinocarboxamide synthase
MNALRSTVDLGLSPDRTGKVREIFDLGDQLLIVATDRISAYDVIMDQIAPGRGCVLTIMTLAWLKQFPEVPNHLITADPDQFPAPFAEHREALAGRSMLVRKATPFPVECIARGYITGSGWRSYHAEGHICGHVLPPGLLKSQMLPEILFTPSTKADEGHDVNISFEETVATIGEADALALRDLTLKIYGGGADYAADRGVLIADTKVEFGKIDGKIVLIDEVLTPDSSRFWPADEHVPGEEPPSWDKQILRNFLDTLDWDQTYPPPTLPDEVLVRTVGRYREVLDILFPEEAALWPSVLS